MTEGKRLDIERDDDYTSFGGRGGYTPYNGLYGEAPPERGIFFRLKVYNKRLGISRVEE